MKILNKEKGGINIIFIQNFFFFFLPPECLLDINMEQAVLAFGGSP
jgi:hypothetical protein